MEHRFIIDDDEAELMFAPVKRHHGLKDDDDSELTIQELATNAIYSIAASIDKNDFAAEVMQAETMIYELIARLAEQHGVTQGSVHEMLSALPAVKNDKVVAEAVVRWRPPSNVLAT